MAKSDSARTISSRDSAQPRSLEPVAMRGWVAPWLQIFVSTLIGLHLIAVIAEPFQMFTRSARGGSPVADSIRRWFAPYVEFAYLNHGYFFFAPDPGPSHVMECRLSKPGMDVKKLRLPDRKAQWPRLLYHRHFMLAEFINTIFVPSELSAEDEPIDPMRRQWMLGRRMYEMVRQSMELHLAKRYGFESTEIRRVEHRWPTAYEVYEEKWPLDDERLYILLPEAPPIERLTTPNHAAFEDRDSGIQSPRPVLPVVPEEIRP